MKNLDTPALPDPMRGGEPSITNQAPYNEPTGFTKREYACIHLGIPESGDPELDELIRKSERKRIAEKALNGILANPSRGTLESMMWDVVNISDALIKKLNT